VPGRARAGELEQLTREKNRPLCQVVRCVTVTAGHGDDISCFEGGPDAAADRLRAVRDDRTHHQPDVVPDALEEPGECVCRIWGAYLCGRSDRDIDDDMRGSGRDLLR
jgi:hypothetical protein